MPKKVVLITDIHGLLEPLQKCMEEITLEKPDAIYCLGDAIGDGPNPEEVLSLLRKNKVTLILGNQEYYETLGMAPFLSYLDLERMQMIDWTNSKLSLESKNWLRNSPCFVDLTLGDKKIGLCHFAGDVRSDWLNHGQAHFQQRIKNRENGAELFTYTNSKEQIKYLKTLIKRYGKSVYVKNILDTLEHPLFHGQSLFSYDAIFEGHVHFEKPSQTYKGTTFYTLRSLSMGYAEKEEDVACYYVLEEVNDGFNFTRKNVLFNRDKMLQTIKESNMPSKKIINKYVKM